MKYKIITAVLLSIFILACNDESSDEDTNDNLNMNDDLNISNDSDSEHDESGDESVYVDITATELKEMLEKDDEIIVIDVSPNYDQGHLPGSINFYVGSDALDNAAKKLDKTGKYVVYCHADSASILGAEKLIEAGFKTIYRLKGNYSGWTDEGYDVVKTSDGYEDIHPHTAHALILANPNTVTVDVSPYFDEGRLPGAINHPVGDGSLDLALISLEKEKTYLVYCHGDSPAILGAEKIFNEGMMPVYRLIDNFGGWVSKGLPVEK